MIARVNIAVFSLVLGLSFAACNRSAPPAGDTKAKPRKKKVHKEAAKSAEGAPAVEAPVAK